MADLKVTIGADAAEYNKIMGGLGLTAKKETDEAARIIDSNSKKISGTISAMGGSVAKGSDRAGLALINLGRVAQDAPFGFVGIQNNINPLLESFQSLVKETGSVKGALGSLIGSLSGGAGLGLAVSLVTAGITAYTMWQQKSKGATDDSKESVDAYSKSIQDSINTGASQLANLSTLYEASQNQNLSLEQRKKAVDALQDQYPDYFKNIKDEAILAGKAANAYNALTQSIINTSLVKAGQDELTESLKPLIRMQSDLQKQQIDIERRNRESQSKNPNKITKFGQVDENGKKIEGFTPVAISGSASAGVDKANQFYIDETTDGILKSYSEQEKQVGDKIKDVQASVQALIAKFGINSLLPQSFKSDDAAKLKEGFAALEEEINKEELSLQKAIISKNEPLRLALSYRVSILKEQLEKYKKLFENPRGAEELFSYQGAPELKSQDNFKSDSFKMSDQSGVLADMQNTLKLAKTKIEGKEANDAYNKSLQEEAAQFSYLQNVIGNGFLSVFESVLSGTQSFISAMGQFLQQLITKFAAAAAAAAVLGAILAFTGIGGATFGSVFGAGNSGAKSFNGLFGAFSGIPKFAEGGIVNQPTLGIMGEAGREAIMPIDKLQNFVSNQGGGNYMPVAQVIGGDLLITWQQQAEKSYNRRS